MKEKLNAVEGEEEPVQTQDEIAAGMLSKKSMVVLGRKRAATENDPTHDQNSHNTTSNEALQATVEVQDQKIEAQRVIIADQATTILELQSQQVQTNKVLDDMRGELTQIYRILALRQNGGTGTYMNSDFLLMFLERFAI